MIWILESPGYLGLSRTFQILGRLIYRAMLTPVQAEVSSIFGQANISFSLASSYIIIIFEALISGSL
jgi:hypothetical protein